MTSIMKKLETLGFYIALYGVVIPFLWIGIMKYAPNEAAAIEPLLLSAPWTSWLIHLFGVQGASSVIGTIEIIGAVSLALYPFSKKLSFLGGLIITGALLNTVSFLLTNTVVVIDESGILFLNSLGSFLIKDITLLGVSIYITARSYLLMYPSHSSEKNIQ